MSSPAALLASLALLAGDPATRGATPGAVPVGPVTMPPDEDAEAQPLPVVPPGYELSARVEARTRTREALGSPTHRTRELELVPRLSASRGDPAFDPSASYHPRLLLADDLATERWEVLHRAALLGGVRLDAAWKAVASARGAYGTNDLLAAQLAGADAPGDGGAPSPIQPLPVRTTVRYVSAETAVAVTGALSGRTRLHSVATALVDGGAGADARRALPLQRSGRLATTHEWDASARDVLSSSLLLSVTDFSLGAVVSGAFLTERWRRALSSGTHAWVGAGGGVSVRDAGGSVSARPFVSGELGLERDARLRKQRLTGSVAVGTAPLQDRVTGGVYERADLRGWLTWSPTVFWELRAHAAGGWVVEGPQRRDTIGAGLLSATWRGGTWDVGGGVNALVQRQPRLSSQPFVEWGAFVATSARHRERF
jgi:hypothetical protein